MNLDAALAAAAEAGAINENEIATIADSASVPARSSHHLRRLLAATATCAALVVCALMFRHRNPAQLSNSDFAAACAASQEAIKRLPVSHRHCFQPGHRPLPPCSIPREPQIGTCDHET